MKNESTLDVDALMTFTVIARPYFILIYTYIYFFQFSGVNESRQWAGNQSKWVRLQTESTVFR